MEAYASKCKSCQIDLVDLQRTNVARAVLLDHLAMNLDVEGREEDALFLWAVMYCAALPPPWYARLQGWIAYLLFKIEEVDQVDYITRSVAREDDATEIRKVLQGWADLPDGNDGKPSLSHLKRSRKRHMEMWISIARNRGSSGQSTSDSDPDWEGALEAMAAQIAAWVQQTDKKLVVLKECKLYLQTGSTYPVDVEKIVGKIAESEWMPNPTLLDPATWEWCLHYGSAPFLSYFPLSLEVEQTVCSKARSGDLRALTFACFQEFRALAAGRKRAVNNVTLRFWLDDATQLCMSEALPPRSYSCIDTSNLLDVLGLLPLLTLTEPLLVKDPKAALFTSTMVWATSEKKSMAEFVQAALGFHCDLAATMVGLRLITRVDLGRESFRAVCTTMTSDTLMWQPAVPIKLESGEVLAAPLPRLDDSPDLQKSLRGLAKACTVNTQQRQGRSGLQFPNTFTLLHLLRGLVGRVEGVLPVGACTTPIDWRTIADHTASLCDLPLDFRAQWNGLICWCFGESAEKGHSKDLPQFLAWKINRSPTFDRLMSGTLHATPLLQAILTVADDPAAAVETFNKGSKDWKSIVRTHTLDVVGFSFETMTAFCVLPPPQGTELDLATVLIQDVSSAPDRIRILSSHQLINDASVSRLTRHPPPRLVAKSWFDAEAQSAASASKACALRHLKVLKAQENLHSFAFSFSIDPSKISKKLMSMSASIPELGDNKKVTEGVRSVSLRLSGDTSVAAKLVFPWPVVGNNKVIKLDNKNLSSGRAQVTVLVKKASVWPDDGELLPKVSVEGLRAMSISKLSTHLGLMFSIEDTKLRANPQIKMSVLLNVKETLQSIFINTLQRGGRLMSCLVRSPIRPQQEPSITLLVHGILQLPDGRPVAHISFVDHERALRLFPTAAAKLTAARRFTRILGAPQVRGAGSDLPMGQQHVACEEGEVPLIREILERNARRFIAPKWQEELLMESPEWLATFITPLYSGKGTLHYMERCRDPDALCLRLLPPPFSTSVGTEFIVCSAESTFISIWSCFCSPLQTKYLTKRPSKRYSNFLT
jgi:hypothetical protein